jgi:NAD(P)-dependent dehydrogenase (short-subunit alcohol dehydrogenase family)
MVPSSRLGATARELFDRMMAVNMRAPLAAHPGGALPQLVPTAARVLNIGIDQRAQRRGRRSSTTAFSKGALTTLSRNLANAPRGRRRARQPPQRRLGAHASASPHQVEAGHSRRTGRSDDPEGLDAVGPRSCGPEEIAAAAVYWLGDEVAAGQRLGRRTRTVPARRRNPCK